MERVLVSNKKATFDKLLSRLIASSDKFYTTGHGSPESIHRKRISLADFPIMCEPPKRQAMQVTELGLAAQKDTG